MFDTEVVFAPLIASFAECLLLSLFVLTALEAYAGAFRVRYMTFAKYFPISMRHKQWAEDFVCPPGADRSCFAHGSFASFLFAGLLHRAAFLFAFFTDLPDLVQDRFAFLFFINAKPMFP